jgi:23S rRNA pseudouridine2457 synthase
MTHRHFTVNKPAGMISQFVNNKTRKKKLLSDLHDFPEGTMAIGRLDTKTEGLLLLTTDGKESARITGTAIEKEYWAQVDGIITDVAIEQLQNSVTIGVQGEEYKTKPAQAKRLSDVSDLPRSEFRIRAERHGPTSWISLTLREGKFKQVRKMTAAVGFPTLRLVRVRIGKLHLGDLEVGNVSEVNQLMV